MAQRYLAEMKYDEAIVAFNKIIEIDEKNVEAYFGLAQVYEAQANIALEEQNSERFDELLALIEAMYNKVLDIAPEDGRLAALLDTLSEMRQRTQENNDDEPTTEAISTDEQQTEVQQTGMTAVGERIELFEVYAEEFNKYQKKYEEYEFGIDTYGFRFEQPVEISEGVTVTEVSYGTRFPDDDQYLREEFRQIIGEKLEITFEYVGMEEEIEEEIEDNGEVFYCYHPLRHRIRITGFKRIE